MFITIFLSVVLTIIAVSISVTSYYQVKSLQLDIAIKERRYLRLAIIKIIKMISK